MNQAKGGRGIRESFRCAWSGFRYALRTQRNLRLHLGIALLVLAGAAWLRLPALTVALLVLTIALVVALELVNTALEALVDLASPDYHPLARVSKDVAAAAVLVASLASVLIGILVVATLF
ncbi:MAG: diacylglycerol kinase family protein [Bacillota bacterium]|nr:diacylglycerol kinase family protein [Bacillota bacterium]